jgi:hypothetical protein
MFLVQTNKQILIEKAKSREYNIEDVKKCIVQEDNNKIIIDLTHPNYPRPKEISYEEFIASIDKSAPKPPLMQNKEQPINKGPGTELKKLLKKIGITSTPTCSCNARANTMDKNGIEWCENNKETIIDWLQEEATKRKLPFIRFAGKKIVDMAIYRAKKNASN